MSKFLENFWDTIDIGLYCIVEDWIAPVVMLFFGAFVCLLMSLLCPILIPLWLVGISRKKRNEL